MKKVIWTLALLFANASLSFLQAQTTYSGLEFLQFNPEVSTFGIGNVTLGTESKMALYTDPAAFMTQEERIYASYGVSFLPQGQISRNAYHAFSAGYKITDEWSIMGGFRMQRGLEVGLVDETGMNYGTYRPVDWSLDLGGAWRFAPRWTGFLTAGFIQSMQGIEARSMVLGAGVNFSDRLSISGLPFRYSSTLALSNFGWDLQYSDSQTPAALPSALGIGGSATLTLGGAHDLTAAVMLSESIHSGLTNRTAFGAGIGYEAFDILALRAGWSHRYGQSAWTIGLGGRYRFLSLDLGYSFTDKKDFNQLRLALNFHL